MLMFLALFLACIGFVSSIEITSLNCRKKANITSKCSFTIRLKPPLTTNLDCLLHFQFATSGPVEFNNLKMDLQPQLKSSCPSFEWNINSKNKFYKLVSSCGKNISSFNETFDSFTYARLIYDNGGYNDLASNISMDLFLIGCDDSGYFPCKGTGNCDIIWIITISCGLALIIIVMVIIFIDFCKKSSENETTSRKRKRRKKTDEERDTDGWRSEKEEMIDEVNT